MPFSVVAQLAREFVALADQIDQHNATLPQS
jgi:hypothetical protein